MARRKRQQLAQQQQQTSNSSAAPVYSASRQPLGGGPAAAVHRPDHRHAASTPHFDPNFHGRPGAAYPPVVQTPQHHDPHQGFAAQPQYAGWHNQPVPSSQPRHTPTPQQGWQSPLPSLWPRTPPHDSPAPSRDSSWRTPNPSAAQPPGLQLHSHQDQSGAETPRKRMRNKVKAAKHGSHAGSHAAPLPILLFDLNGTLTSHTAARRSQGTTKLRPGLHHLHRLTGRFQLGIFSSASAMTVNGAVAMIQQAVPAANGALFSHSALIFTRQHTQAAPQTHISAGGKDWDTAKPLHSLPCCQSLQQVLLIDDDDFKAVDGERSNMVLVPRWDDTDNADTCIGHLVDALLQLVPCPPQDVRHFSRAVELQVAKRCHRQKMQPVPRQAAHPPQSQVAAEEEEEMTLIYGMSTRAPSRAQRRLAGQFGRAAAVQ